jgi:hypothetical protein
MRYHKAKLTNRMEIAFYHALGALPEQEFIHKFFLTRQKRYSRGVNRGCIVSQS